MGKVIDLETPNNYDYSSHPVGDVSRLKSIVFSVKAKNDACIALNLEGEGLWEIGIGCWGNTRSVLRLKSQGSEVEVGSRDHNPLSEIQFHTFWISWTD